MRIFILLLLFLYSCSTFQGGKKDESNNDSIGLVYINPYEKVLTYDEDIDSLVIDEPLFDFYSTINRNIFKANNSNALWNNKEIPSRRILYFQNRFFFFQKKQSLFTFYEIDSIGNKFELGSTVLDNIYITLNNVFTFKNKVLYEVNPINQKLDTIAYFSNNLSGKNDYENKNITINQISLNHIQLEFSSYNSGCIDFESYVINIAEKKVVYDNNLKKNEIDNKGFKICFWLYDEVKKHFLVYIDNSNIYSSNENYILDEEFNIIKAIPKKKYGIFPCSLCEFYNNFKGINVQNDSFTSFYLNTYVTINDKEKRVLIPYFLNSQLEMLFAKVFNNEKLMSYELEALNNIELKLVKKFIFAKHNYAFKEMYYQAFFSTFEFYNPRKLEPIESSDIAQQLTEIDKYNLSLLN